ncbi:MAG: ADP-ribosylglycohydrolase [Akkermansiaceae bacterium]|nr:ADP-ribosylglycohydrolase [Akkermansiaceae bacterium]
MNLTEGSSERQNWASGTLVGLAVGDALGTTLEFKSPGTFEPLTDMIGLGPFRLKPGQWTDDTSMALCLAESLIECKGFDLNDQASRYVRWSQEGYLSSNGYCFDIGNTVAEALRFYRRTGIPESGSTDPFSAGNGSIMRLAPVPIFFHDPQQAIDYAALSSRSTHQAATCLDACRYLGGLIAGFLQGATRDEILSPLFHPVKGRWETNELHPEIAAIAAGSFKNKMPPEIAGTGYVVQSLEAALWAFHRSSSFEEGALMAVNLGDDADTTGAVYGQIAGAYYGLSGIPERWVEKLAKLDLILDYAKRLNDASIP